MVSSWLFQHLEFRISVGIPWTISGLPQTSLFIIGFAYFADEVIVRCDFKKYITRLVVLVVLVED